MKARNASIVVADFSAEGTTSDSLGCKSQVAGFEVPGFEAPSFLERSTASSVDRSRSVDEAGLVYLGYQGLTSQAIGCRRFATVERNYAGFATAGANDVRFAT